MFREKGARGRVCPLALVILWVGIIRTEPDKNIYHGLYHVFARELDQKGIQGGAMATLANLERALNTHDRTSLLAARVARLGCIYCEVCADQEAAKALPFCGDISRETLEKLGLVAAPGQDSNYSVLHKLALPGESVFGTVARAELFMRLPTYTELCENQQITRYFVEHPEERKKALGALEKIRTAQNDFLWLFLTKERENDRLEDLYWSLGGLTSLNKSMTGLFLADLWEQLTKTVPGLTPPCALIGLTSGIWEGLKNTVQGASGKPATEAVYGLIGGLAYIPISGIKGFGRGIAGEFMSHWPGTYAYGVEHNTDSTITLRNANDSFFTTLGDRRAQVETVISTSDWLSDLQAACNVAMKPWTSAFNTRDPHTKEILKDKNGVEIGKGVETFMRSRWRTPYGMPLVSWPMAVLGLAWQDFFNYYNIRSTYKKVKKDLATFKLAQARLINIAQLQNGLKELAAVVKKSGVGPLKGLAHEIDALATLKKTNEKFAQFSELLATNTFKGEPSIFSNRARILLAHRLLRKCKSFFLPAVHAAGQIETFVAAAEFYAKHQSPSDPAAKPACFVEFVDERRPQLELENCWNVLVDEQKAVCIDRIAFGKNGSQHAIFSGPNGTGKSTNENAIAHAIFMGRLGIACASRAVMTPFEVCEVHRNEQENIEHGDSSFMAQRARFDDICTRIAGLEHQRMIIFMDEPLNGTVEAEAGRIIFERCRQLFVDQHQAICLIATHAEQVTALEEATKGIFKNYFVEVEEPEPGHFVRTYRLRTGIPRWWFDDVERRHRFVEWLSTERKKDT